MSALPPIAIGWNAAFGAAITTALIDVLIAKGVLGQSEPVDIGYRAQNLIGNDPSAEAAEARRMIAEMLIGEVRSGGIRALRPPRSQPN